MEALSRVNHAPALRSLQLGYNSIGPKGAAALANWPVLARVWHVELHDNIIGDDGLIALAKSPNLGRLLELDLEQDCWNSRTFTFSDHAAKALANSQSLPRLDNLFSGCVDEYHGTAYSPGFTKAGLDAVRKSEWMRPAFKAACSDFSGVSEYLERPEFDEMAELGDHDFRRHPFTLNNKEAETGEHRMQQIRSPSGVEEAFDDKEPTEIRPSLPEIDFNDEDVIEGLEFRDPTPLTDTSLRLDLSLEDGQRPLPNQVGKLLSDTLQSIFKASSLGYFEVSGASSRKAEDGRTIHLNESFRLGIKGNAQPAIQLIREALWWVGAPGATDLDKFPLALTEEPVVTTSRFLQLATPKIAQWKWGNEPGYRIDRVPFSTTQRESVRRILAEVSSAESTKGWVEVAMSDGGRMAIYIKYLNESADFDNLNILVDVLSPDISGLVHKIMQECAFFLLPMAFAPSAQVAGTIDCEWPKVKVVASAAALHELLVRGPYQWWRHALRDQR